MRARKCVFLKLCCITVSCYLSPRRVRVKTSASSRTNPCGRCPIGMLGFFFVYCCWFFLITMVTCCSRQSIQSLSTIGSTGTIKFYPFTGWCPWGGFWWWARAKKQKATPLRWFIYSVIHATTSCHTLRINKNSTNEHKYPSTIPPLPLHARI